MEKLLPSAEVAEREEEENEDESEEEEEEDDDDDDYDDEKGDDGDEGEDGRDDEEAMTQAKDKTEKSSPPAKPPKEKKVSDVLNLNNEVVKMRKEVKRLRALIIRKLIRHIGDLKKKKGNKAAVEKNQRRAARLLEEIYAMKALLPDQVTKTALQKDLNFEQVCKNPKSTISDRAIARIATHPQFNKKIVDIKAAVKAFKEERMKSIKQGRKQKVENEAGNVDHQLPDIRTERKSYKEEEDNTMQLMNMPDKADDVIVKCAVEAADSTVAKPEKDTGMTTGSANLANVQQEEMPKPTIEKPTSTKSNEVKDAVKKETQNKNAGKKLRPAVLQEREDEEESDLESSDEEEKQYFDDSTEERFHKQSSQSEESEDDDFFVGKVSKFKKKKQKGVESENKVEEGQEVKKDSIEKVKSVDKVQSDLDALESRLKCKATSVFCRLSGFKESTGAGAGRGRGGDKFRGQKKPYDGRGLKSKAFPEGGHRESEKRGFGSAGRGRGRGRGEAIRQKMHTSSGAFSLQAPQQALHPSWEASKKRKEQQGQILAFQGKKIKFDDDDD